MSSYQPRFPISFTDTNGTASDGTGATLKVQFPRGAFEWNSDQSLLVPTAQSVGSDYEFDLLGTARAPKGNATEALRFLFKETDPATVDSDVDTFQTAMAQIGLGKLWTQDKNGVDRWSYARSLSLASFKWGAGDIFKKAASINFRRQSDWFSATAYAGGPFTIDASPKTVTVNNTGTAKVYNAVFIFKGTYAGPVTLLNTTNGYSISSTRAGSHANDWLKIDAGASQVNFSTDGGATYTGDFAIVTLGSGKVRLMVLEPGNNVFTVTGANGSTLTVIFYPAYD